MCTICALTIEFAVDHPMTLAVAVATRRAIDTGLLPPGDTEEMDMAASRHQAVVLLTTLQQRIEQVLPASRLLALPDFYVLMIESRTWGYFHPTHAGFDIRADPSTPRVTPDENGLTDNIIVLSQAAATQLVAGHLPFDQASLQGILVIDAPITPASLIHAALATAYPADQYSEFVCTEVA